VAVLLVGSWWLRVAVLYAELSFQWFRLYLCVAVRRIGTGEQKILKYANFSSRHFGCISNTLSNRRSERNCVSYLFSSKFLSFFFLASFEILRCRI
jgi:hypothetical protein